MNFPVTPSVFETNLFDNRYYENDFMFTPDGIGEFPEHHCKLTWVDSFPYIKNFRNAVDIGCRDGEYTRFLQKDFKHVYCFDYRRRKLLHKNIDVDKITHFKCALGDEHKLVKVSGAGSMTSGKIPTEKWYEEQIYTLDQFNLSDVDYIKIDVDGYELNVLKGSIETIKKFSPLLVIEQENGVSSSIEFCKTLDYEILKWDNAKRNVIMGKTT